MSCSVCKCILAWLSEPTCRNEKCIAKYHEIQKKKQKKAAKESFNNKTRFACPSVCSREHQQ